MKYCSCVMLSWLSSSVSVLVWLVVLIGRFSVLLVLMKLNVRMCSVVGFRVWFVVIRLLV